MVFLQEIMPKIEVKLLCGWTGNIAVASLVQLRVLGEEGGNCGASKVGICFNMDFM